MRASVLALLVCALAAPTSSALLPPEPAGHCDMTRSLVCIDADSFGSARCRSEGDPSFAMCSLDSGAAFIGSSPAGAPGSAAATILLTHTLCAYGDCVQTSEMRELSCTWDAGVAPSCGNEFETISTGGFALEPGQCVVALIQSQIDATGHALFAGSPVEVFDAAVFSHADAYCSPS